MRTNIATADRPVRARSMPHAGSRKSRVRAATTFLTALALASAAPGARLSAQQPLDRDVIPPPGPAPTLHVPSWTHTRLSNGAQLVVAPKHDLPLVSFNIQFIGGADNYESAGKVGTASFAGQMLSEGTKTRDADELSNAQQLLGTSIRAGVGGEGGSIGFTSLTDRFQPALALLADMLLNPTFPEEALERIRGRELVALRQAKDRPNSIAVNVFMRVLYGDNHPYGRIETEATVNAITRADIVDFHRAYFRPGRAVITVTGDIDEATAKAAVEQALAAWPTGGEPPAFDYPALPEPKPTTIYLVDKPGAPQSVFAIGEPGPPRDTPDYYAIEVMNTLLGGLFQSRLNHDIREVRGWSYGVGSGFSFGHGPGPFEAGGGLVTEKTDSALIAFMTHFRGVQGAVPFTADELMQGKESLIQSLPRRFASVNAMASSIGSLYTEGLPEDYYQRYGANVNAVTAADMVRVAEKYIDLSHLAIVIVGDRAAVEAPLEATGIAPIRVLDADGNPVS